MKEDVKFTCPLCGKEWIEEQDTNDEWFRLATTRTLCEECGKKAIRKSLSSNLKRQIKEEDENDI